GKPKWLDLDLVAELERDQAHAIWERIQQAGIKESGTVVEELLAELAPPITMESTDDDIQRRMQVKSALALLLEEQRTVAVEGLRVDLQGSRAAEDRRRQAPPGRPRRRGDPADRGRGRRQPACPRLRPVHARPDADPLLPHARHREGGAAHRRPLPRGGAPLHA